jgi:hypothetical protein
LTGKDKMAAKWHDMRNTSLQDGSPELKKRVMGTGGVRVGLLRQAG